MRSATRRTYSWKGKVGVPFETDRMKIRTLTTSNSTPIAGSGVRMSLNMITPSGLKARQGCNESSMAISGVSERCRKPYLLEYSRNSAMYLPACRMSQTGGLSPCSPRATRNSKGSLEIEDVIKSPSTPVLVEAFAFRRIRLLRFVVALGDARMIPHKAVIWVRRAGILC